MSAAHLIFCKNPLGSFLLGRDVRDYYRNFILSPHTWWKTYGFASGAFWFNPYLPFGGSSCTSLAQRQSDAIRSIAKAIRIGADTVAMLDDFLGVVRREQDESDEAVIARGQQAVARFDSLLADLGLPIAPEKSQGLAFTTI